MDASAQTLEQAADALGAQADAVAAQNLALAAQARATPAGRAALAGELASMGISKQSFERMLTGQMESADVSALFLNLNPFAN